MVLSQCKKVQEGNEIQNNRSISVMQSCTISPYPESERGQLDHYACIKWR